MKKGCLIGLSVLGLLMPSAQAQVPSREARVTLNVAERELEAVVDHLRERSGANIVIMDPDEAGLAGKPISLQLQAVHWRTALELAAEKAGAVVQERKDGILLVVMPPLVQLEARDMSIVEVIELIAKAGEANVVVGEDVTGTMSVRLNGVPWRDALEVVAKTRGYTVVEERGGVLRVVDPLRLQEQLVTESYQLRYLRPRGQFVPRIQSEFIQGQLTPPTGEAGDHFTVLKALSKALSGAGQMDYIENQNVVIVRDTQQVHEEIKTMLARLDIEPSQVFVDVKFVSTGNSDLLDLGVDYGDAGPTISMSGGQIPITFPFDQGPGGWDDWIIASPTGEGPFTFSDALSGNAGGTFVPDTIFGALSFTQVQATLRMLARDVTTEVFQAPKIIALDGYPATIFVGETIRYAEAKSEQGQAGGLQLSLEEAESSPVEVGFQLLIKPHVIPGEGKIIMDVIPKETSLAGTGQSSVAPPGFDVFTIGAAGLEGSIALPRTRSSTIVTTMMLENGETAVIGGLTTESDTKTVSRVPYISRIPLLGELFKHRTKNRERRSLLVFITPTLVHGSQDTELLLQQELRRRRMRISEEIDNLTGGAWSQEIEKN